MLQLFKLVLAHLRNRLVLNHTTPRSRFIGESLGETICVSTAIILYLHCRVGVLSHTNFWLIMINKVCMRLRMTSLILLFIVPVWWEQVLVRAHAALQSFLTGLLRVVTREFVYHKRPLWSLLEHGSAGLTRKHSADFFHAPTRYRVDKVILFFVHVLGLQRCVRSLVKQAVIVPYLLQGLAIMLNRHYVLVIELSGRINVNWRHGNGRLYVLHALDLLDEYRGLSDNLFHFNLYLCCWWVVDKVTNFCFGHQNLDIN